MSGQALQSTTVTITLPSGAQQQADTNDSKGAFHVAPDPDNPDRSIAHLNLEDGGDGLHLVTNESDGSVIWGGIVYHGSIVDSTVEPSSSEPSSDGLDSAIDDSDGMSKFSSRIRITGRESGRKITGGIIVLTPLIGSVTDGHKLMVDGEAQFTGLTQGVYRVDIFDQGAALYGYRTPPGGAFTRYVVLGPKASNPLIRRSSSESPVRQALAWWSYFDKKDNAKAAAAMGDELRLYGILHPEELMKFLSAPGTSPAGTLSPSEVLSGEIPPLPGGAGNANHPVKAAISPPTSQGDIGVLNLDTPNQTFLGSAIRIQSDCLDLRGWVDFDRYGMLQIVGLDPAIFLRFATEGSRPPTPPGAQQLVDTYLDRINRIDHHYPINSDIWGNSLELHLHDPKSRDTIAIEKLRRAGAIILGKGGLSEWANFSGVSSSPGTAPVNPYLESHNKDCADGLLPDLFPDDYPKMQIAKARHGLVPGIDPVPQPKSLPRDPFFYTSGHAKAKVADQWGLREIGFQATRRDRKGSLWPKMGAPVLVAVVDTGLDLDQPDLKGVLWTNAKETPGNGRDDDSNGLVDDVSGWNFLEFNNNVRDDNGHGTFVTGIIAANTDNVVGIAGVNPWARILPVKVSNFANDSDSVSVAMGISYAARMGARVINVSIGGKSITKAEQAAVEFANSKGALVVVAAGNDGANIKDYSPAGLDGVIVATAINHEGKRENYSNWGDVDIAAPGSDIVSLRAARTDLMQFELKDYKPGTNVIGRERLLYYASGTSFAAPYVTGVASLLLSINPKLTAAEVKRMILQSAKDIDVPGTDQFTGYGLLDAAAALKADPKFHVDAAIDGVGVVNKGGPQVRVTGTADADKFKRAWIEIGKGENPGRWKKVAQVRKAVQGAALGDIPAAEFGGAKEWVIRLVVEHRNGRKRENRFILKLG
jgi:subtilisin family serine protease